MKKTLPLLAALAACVTLIIAWIQCPICKGSGWNGTLKCWSCRGDGKIGE